MMSVSSSSIREFESALARIDLCHRPMFLDRIAELFLEGAPLYSEEQIEAFDAILCILAIDTPVEARASLSRALAPIPNAPLNVILSLARDASIEVAGPVLSRSKRLGNEALIDIAETASQKHLLAIARRKALEASVTSVLIALGDRAVLKALAANKSTEISEEGYKAFVERSKWLSKEKRHARRIPLNQPAWVRFGKNFPDQECVLVDLSTTGAHLILPDDRSAPEMLFLKFAERGNALRACSLIWRRGRDAGIEFVK